MILFTPEMAQAIRERRKCVTRRRWKKPRVKVGSWQLFYTRMPFAKGGSKPFARAQIVSVSHELFPGQLNPAGEWQREGFADFEEFAELWRVMHGVNALSEPCYRVEWDPNTMELLEGE